MTMTMTIEIQTATDWADVEFPVEIQDGLKVVAGTEVHESFILACDGQEFPLTQIDEANWASAQFLFDNYPEEYDPRHWSNAL